MNWFNRSKPETIKTQRFDDYLKDHPIFMDHHGTLLFALVGPAIKNIMLGKYEKVSLLHLFYPEEYEAAKAGKLPPNAQIVFSDSLPNAPAVSCSLGTRLTAWMLSRYWSMSAGNWQITHRLLRTSFSTVMGQRGKKITIEFNIRTKLPAHGISRLL